jgi:hypothetical protein
LVLLKNGADRNVKSRSGYTAEMIAKESGFNEIVQLLSSGGGA